MGKARVVRNQILGLLKLRWVQASLIIGGFLAAFLGGMIVFWTAQNFDRIKNRLSPPKPVELEGTIVSEWSDIETGLVTLHSTEIKLADLDIFSSGGAIDSVGDTILYVSATGFIGSVNLATGNIGYTDHRVPMDYDRLHNEVFAKHLRFNQDWYRVQDIMIRRHADPNTATLYVTHHVFVEENAQICSVISRTGLDLSNNAITLVDGVWEELYRIRECVSMEETNWKYYGLESGGAHADVR